LREGKTTLPLIAAMQRGTASERELIQSAIETGKLELIDQVRGHRAKPPAPSMWRVKPQQTKHAAPSARPSSCQTMRTGSV